MKSKFFIAPVLIASLLCIKPSHAQEKTETQKKGITSLNVSTDNWNGSDETRIDYLEDGHRYKIRLNGSKIIEMYIDGKQVSEADYSKYDPTVKKILAQLEKDREQAQKDRDQAALDRKQAEKDRALAEQDRLQAGKDRERAIIDRGQADLHRKQADKDRAQSVKDREQADKDRAQSVKDREQAERDRAQAVKDREQADMDRKQAVKDRAQAELDRKQAEKDRARAAEDRKLINDMIDELIKEKLIDDRDALTSLELDNSRLVVNGKEQDASLHSRFKTKYLKGDHTRIRYRSSGDSRTMSID